MEKFGIDNLQKVLNFGVSFGLPLSTEFKDGFDYSKIFHLVSDVNFMNNSLLRSFWDSNSQFRRFNSKTSIFTHIKEFVLFNLFLPDENIIIIFETL